MFPAKSHASLLPAVFIKRMLCVQVLNKWLLIKEKKRGKESEGGTEGGRGGKTSIFLATMLGSAYTFRPPVP